MKNVFKFLVFGVLFIQGHNLVAKSLPAIGQRLYIVDEKGRLTISTLKEGQKKEHVKKFQDPIFDSKLFFKLEEEEKQALIRHSELVDKKSIISIGTTRIKARQSKPRVIFAPPPKKVAPVEEEFEFNVLEKTAINDKKLDEW